MFARIFSQKSDAWKAPNKGLKPFFERFLTKAAPTIRFVLEKFRLHVCSESRKGRLRLECRSLKQNLHHIGGRIRSLAGRQETGQFIQVVADRDERGLDGSIVADLCMANVGQQGVAEALAA